MSVRAIRTVAFETGGVAEAAARFPASSASSRGPSALRRAGRACRCRTQEYSCRRRPVRNRRTPRAARTAWTPSVRCRWRSLRHRASRAESRPAHDRCRRRASTVLRRAASTDVNARAEIERALYRPNRGIKDVGADLERITGRAIVEHDVIAARSLQLREIARPHLRERTENRGAQMPQVRRR